MFNMKNLADLRKMVEKGVDPRPSSPIYIYGQLYGYHLCEWPSNGSHPPPPGIEGDTADCGR